MPIGYTLYWSSLVLYEDCPKGFLWNRGWGAIDLGRGPGRSKPKPVKSSRHHAILGIAIQEAIERFYNDRLWQSLTPRQLRNRLLELGEQAFKRELSGSYVDWRKAPTRDEMEVLVRTAILGYMRTLQKHRLLGPYTRAEVDLVGYANKYTPIGGRADTIVRRDDTGITILDGKNSNRYKAKASSGQPWMTYTDPDQLRWYALCFYLAYKKLPDRLGFVYYRFPYGAPMVDLKGEPVLDENGEQRIEEGVEWVTYTKEDLEGLRERAIAARKGMDKQRFEADPSPNTCRFCDYVTVCPERQAQIESNRRRRKGNPLAGTSGFQMLDFEGGPTPVPEG